MLDPKVYLLAIAALIGFVIGAERRWRGFKGSAPFHVAPALFGAFLVTRQTGLTALFWFLPLQILMWLIVTATVCMWSAERTPDGNGDFRGTGGTTLSWALAFLLGVACAFQAWLLLACAGVALAVFGLRTPRRISVPAVVATPVPAAAVPGEVAIDEALLADTKPAPLSLAEAVQQLGSGKPVSRPDAGSNLKRVNGDAGGATESAVDGAVVEPALAEPLLQRSAA